MGCLHQYNQSNPDHDDYANRPDTRLLAPAPSLRGCLRGLYWYDLRPWPDPPAAARETFVPAAPYNAIVWRLDGEARLTERGGRPCSESLPSVFVAGAHRHPYRSRADGRHCVFGLVFQPGILALLSGRPLGEWRDRIAAAASLLPREWSLLLAAVARAADHPARVAAAEDFLGPRWRALSDAAGRLPGARSRGVRDQLTASDQRRLQRQFRRLVGLRPGEVTRMLRLEAALRDLRDGRLVRVADAAGIHGFADQPHFGRAVRAGYDASPGALLRRLAGTRRDGHWLLGL